LACWIQTNLEERNPATYAIALERLSQLTNLLAEMSRQVARRKEERDNLLALAGIGQVVNSSLKLDDVLRIVMDTIVRLTGAERGFLMLRNEKGDMAIDIARNLEQETLNDTEFAISRTVVNRVITQGQPVLTTNAQEDPRFDSQESVITLNLRSILCVPLKVKGELTGVIYADNRIRTGLFTRSDLELLSAFANQAAVAIENARLFESVRKTLSQVTELKNLMDDIFASIASGVITADLEDRITLANQAAESILGKQAEELIGRKITDIPPLCESNIDEHLDYVRRTDRQLIGMELNPELPEGGSLSWSYNLSPLKDAVNTTRGVAIVLEDLTEKKRLETQRKLFERMVSPAVIKHIDAGQLQLGGDRIMITTLFADIRGFTSFGENHDPEQLIAVVNQYLGAAANAILTQEGTIDKFLGDAVMAFFNAPIPQPDHALRAVNAALSIQRTTRTMKSALPLDFQPTFGIGIHTGEAVLGLIGTQQRMEYTAIGDSINTAKRLQENAAPGQILISADVYRTVHQFVKAFPVAPVHAKGKRVPIQVYEVVDLI
jgi:PAS domain S-box-containing protein